MKKQILSILLCLSMAVALLPAISQTVAAADTVTYLDAEGNPQSASAAPVTSGLTAWSSGWYYVSGDVSLASVTVSGDVHLILTDHSRLTVTGSDESSAGICVEGSNSLTIYGQAYGSGMLTATGGDWGAGIGSGEGGIGGTIIINGGTVTASGVSDGAGIGGGYICSSCGTITINGGSVMASGGLYGAGIGGGNANSGGTVTINGGTVTATGEYGAGIGGGDEGYGCTVNISGGSVKASSIGCGFSCTGGTLQNGSGSDVSLTTVTLSDVSVKTAVTSLTTSLTGYSYGIKDMQTDESGSLYLYLPSGTTVTAANTQATQYHGSISSGGTGDFPINYSLTGLTLSNSSVQENVPVGTAVGALSTSVSGSVSSSFTYQLVSGEGDADNGSFSISGDSLKLAVSPDYETKNSYSIRIRTTNGDGLYLEQPLQITITDVNEAPVISAFNRQYRRFGRRDRDCGQFRHRIRC